jgi:hypothetical protein
MKSEFKKIDNDITGIVSDIPADKLKDIYFNRYKDALKALWMNQDEPRFNKQMDDLYDFMDRMTYEQRRACIGQDVKAYHDTCFDLRIWLRSEAIEGMTIMFAYNWLVAGIKDELESYKASGDYHWIDSALKSCDEILNPFYEKYWNDDTVNDISDYLDRMEDAPELTDEDKKRLKTISDWVRIYGLYKDLKTKEKAINE